MAIMDLSEKLYQLPVLQRIDDLRESGISTPPLVVEFDPTSACDLACPGCISGELLNKERFTPNRLVELAREMAESGVRAVILIGGGEPLAHPSIGEVLRIFGGVGVQIGITTNGTMIDRYIEEISQFAAWTRVSIDAGTDATFRRLRPTRAGESKFELILENMRRLAECKTGILGYSFLIRTPADGETTNAAGAGYGLGQISDTNVHEIRQAAEIARDVGCDYFEVKPSYDDDHHLVVHSANYLDEARRQIFEAKELESEAFKVVESVNLRHALRGVQMEEQPKTYTSCPSAQLRTLVTPSGVYVCPYFRGREEMSVGDVTNQSFLEMWESGHRAAVMEFLNPSVHCTMHCIRHETNLAAFQLLEEPVHALGESNSGGNSDLFI